MFYLGHQLPIFHFMNSIALIWMSSIVYAESVDCANVIQFADNLGVQTSQPTIWTALHSDCCTTNGITCDGSPRVTRIDWSYAGLNGTINGTAIPPSVTHLYLQENDITGNIPSQLPFGLRYLYLFGNKMSGDLTSFPNTLTHLYLGQSGYPGNHFTGTLSLNQPIRLRINDNWITDVVIQDSSAISVCDLSDNPLLGNPNIANLTMCSKGGLYSAVLLPVTMSLMTTLESTSGGGAFQGVSIGLTTTSKANTALTEIIASEVSKVTLSHSFLPLNPVLSLLGIIKLILKVVMEMILMILVIYKTPWKREFKSKLEKLKGKGAGNMLLTA